MMQIWKDASLTGWTCASEDAGGVCVANAALPPCHAAAEPDTRPSHERHTADGTHDPTTKAGQSWPPPLGTPRRCRARTRNAEHAAPNPSHAGRPGRPFADPTPRFAGTPAGLSDPTDHGGGIRRRDHGAVPPEKGRLQFSHT